MRTYAQLRAEILELVRSAGSKVTDQELNAQYTKEIIAARSQIDNDIIFFSLDPSVLKVSLFKTETNMSEEDRLSLIQEFLKAARKVGQSQGSKLHVRSLAELSIAIKKAAIEMKSSEAEKHNRETRPNFLANQGYALLHELHLGKTATTSVLIVNNRTDYLPLGIVSVGTTTALKNTAYKDLSRTLNAIIEVTVQNVEKNKRQYFRKMGGRTFDISHLGEGTRFHTPVSFFLQENALSGKITAGQAHVRKALYYLNQLHSSFVDRKGGLIGNPTLETSFIKTITDKDVSGVLSITVAFPELSAKNQGKASLERELLNYVKKLVASRDIILARSSPAIIDLIEDKVIDTIKGKKSLTKRFRTSKKETVVLNKTKTSASNKKGKIKEVPIKPIIRTAIRSNLGRFTSLPKIMATINARLHDQIRTNMGKPALVYRTGRFAESARVTSINNTPSGILNLRYTYMKEPYGVFEPENGHWLANRHRDPKSIIGKSIRQLMAQEVSAQLRITRV
jgi:hypothetical protein